MVKELVCDFMLRIIAANYMKKYWYNFPDLIDFLQIVV